jgi:tryptophanase
VQDNELSGKLIELLILIEGYRTYGGMAGRDLEAVSRGLEEVTDEDYLRFRTTQVRWLGEKIEELGIRVVRPIGGHAVFIDACSVFPLIPKEQFPGHVLTIELYREGGIRAVEIGSLMFGAVNPETGKFVPAPYELVRLAVPRRVYTESHLAYVVEALRQIQKKKDLTTGYKLIYESKYLRHFTARLAPVTPTEHDVVAQ